MTTPLVLCIFGTRPEAIKMAPLIGELRTRPGLRLKVCVTAQHREMLDQVLDLFDIRTDHDLQIMQPGQDLSDLTARLLQKLRSVFVGERPDLVLVHGDTTTTMAVSLAAYYTRVPVGHVFVYPVHLNPQVQEPVSAILRTAEVANIFLIPPQEYAAFVHLLDRCTLVLTDSGGVQEEAPSFGKPVVVMRETTERPEAVDAGTACLAGNDRERIVAAVSRLLADPAHYQAMSQAVNPYGDGRAAPRIAAIVEEYLTGGRAAGTRTTD